MMSSPRRSSWVLESLYQMEINDLDPRNGGWWIISTILVTKNSWVIIYLYPISTKIIVTATKTFSQKVQCQLTWFWKLMQEQNAGFPTQAAEVAMDYKSYQVSHTGNICERISYDMIVEIDTCIYKQSYLDDDDDDDDNAMWSMILAISSIICFSLLLSEHSVEMGDRQAQRLHDSLIRTSISINILLTNHQRKTSWNQGYFQLSHINHHVCNSYVSIHVMQCIISKSWF